MNRLLVFPVFFAVLTGVVRAEQNIAGVCPVASHKIAQLDLARQMETTTFVSNWLTRVSELGYDMVRLYVDLVLPDVFGIPRWTFEGRFDGIWKEIAKGAWKPGAGDDASFTRRVDFKSEVFPDAVRVSYCGFGKGHLAHFAIENRVHRIEPISVAGMVGAVANAEAVLTDDIRTADFGRDGFVDFFADYGKSLVPSVIEFDMGAQRARHEL